MKYVIQKTFLVFAALGILTTLGLCLKQPFDGDTAGIGIAALAQPVDPILFNLSFPIMDPYTFEDMIPGIILQWTTDYSPMAISLLGYLEYLIVIGACSGLVYWTTRDLTRSILCAAMISLLSIGTQILLSLTLYHNITIALAIVYMMWYFDGDEKHVESQYIPLLSSLFIIYSDAMFLALFTLPYTLYTVGRSIKNKTFPSFNSLISIILMLLFGITTYALKASAGYTPKGLSITNISMITGILTNSAQNVLGMLTSFFDIYSSNIIFSLGLLGAWFIAFIIIIIKLDLIEPIFEPRFRYIVFMMGTASILLMSCNLVFVAFWAPRFLIYAVLLGVIILAIGYNKKSHLQTGAIMIFLSVGLIFNLSIMIVEPTPNQPDHQLIEFLKAHNLTYGYSDFRTANVATYLSKGDLHILIADYRDDTIYFQRSHCEMAWYHQGPAFIVYDSNAYNDSRLRDKPKDADHVYEYGEFTIYYWNNPKIEV